MTITKKKTISLFIGYILFILGETLLFRGEYSDPNYHLRPFWSYEQWDYYGPQIIANVVLFIPLGFLLGKMIGWKGIPVAAGISMLIEFIQLITLRGVFEIDDIIHNTLGALIGTACWMCLHRISKSRGEKT